MERIEVKKSFKDSRCCVILPTYNNQGTLKRVVEELLQYSDDLIIVNDGSTDSTSSILAEFPAVEQVHFTENRGKGIALRTGFEKARSLGYEYAISIDSDGQHLPSELPVFLDALKSKSEEEDILLIGSRNMEQKDVPKKSSFGHKFSNFWYWVETGIQLTDTQSGYRLYPLQPLDELTFYTPRFEFEIEVIVRAAWEGVQVGNVPVSVIYDPVERVSHFRPFQDFMRISYLNTVLIILRIFYILPRNFIRKTRSKGWKRFLKEDLLGHDDSPLKKALSMSLGVFIGLTPLWGLHTLITLGLAFVLKLNKALAFAASNVSIPPMIPLVVAASLKIGSLITGEPIGDLIPADFQDLDVFAHLKVYVIGSFVLASISSVIVGGLTYLFLTMKSRSNSLS